MLNKTGVLKESFVNVEQILFNVVYQVSVSVLVDQSVVTSADAYGNKIAKAGTPLTGDLDARTTAFTAAQTSGSPTATSNAVGILLHDVDLTQGDENGTLLIFGFVNTSRIDSTTAAKITDEVKAALPMICFAAMDDKAEE